MRNPKIDPALRERRAVLELLQRVDKPEITYAELEGIAEELVGAGSQAGAVLLQEIAKTEDLDRLNKLTFLAAYLDDERIVEPLSKLLFHPKRSRAYKAQILQALERLGVDVNNRFYQAVFRRREAMRLNLVELRRRLAVRPEAAVQFLYDVFYATTEQRLATMRLLIEDRDVGSLSLAGLLAEVSEDAVSKQVVAALARTRSPESAGALAAMARYAAWPRLVAEAGRGVRRLQFSGVALPELPVPRPEAVRAWAGRVEGNGTQMVWLAALRDEKDSADTVCFLVHETRGLIDCFGEVRASLSQFVSGSVQEGDDDGGRQVSLDYAVQLVENALYLSYAQGLPLPPEYPFRIRCLNLAPVHPRRRPLTQPVALGQSPDWKGLCELFDEPVLDDWLINEPAFFQLVSAFFERGKFERPEMDQLVADVFREFVQPELPLMRQRLALNAVWVREWKGDESIALRLETAAATLDGDSAAQNPFVQHFILRSVREAHDMLREGYDPSLISDEDF